MQNAFAIGLYSYSLPHPGGEGFQRFYNLVMESFQEVGLTPTYFAAEGTGYRGDFSKFGGRVHSKAVKTEFAGINVMSLVVNPEGSDEPGYDSFVSASLGYVDETGELLLCFSMEERFMAFDGENFLRVFKSLVELLPWDFGYALSQPVEQKPEFHVLGLDGGTLSEEDRCRLNSWYASVPEERIRRVRDIYPYIILNKEQLSTTLSNGETLEKFAQKEQGSVLTCLDGSPLLLWRIKPGAISEIRTKLAGERVLIT